MSKIFISYSSKDREWAANWLLPKLEAAGFEVCIDYRDFQIGRASLINMEEAVERCDKILLVLTPHWVESEWTNFEGLLVQTGDPGGIRGRLLPLMLKQCELPQRLKIFTYADFKEESHWFAFSSYTSSIASHATVNSLCAVQPPSDHESWEGFRRLLLYLRNNLTVLSHSDLPPQMPNFVTTFSPHSHLKPLSAFESP